ncbi:dienelactone hydrolase family protein [Nocardioides zhouii]|uniref:Dienelactone hydrolase family protein n=2 Tax=Nocardioides zhouii TaxID=1168729 RepID=A0A4Q2SM98_9ACTN|nr:dienelactone hydrolase family protein [Nocardioides zhouii]
MPAHLWLPASGSGPGVLLLQEIFGISPYIERRAQDLADLGYVVVAPEIWWRQGVSRVAEGPDAMDIAFGLLNDVDWAAAVGDSIAGLDVLRQRDEVTGGVGVMGFCFGGGLAFDVAARTQVDALVSYYGSALPDLLGVVEADPRVTVVGPEAVTAPSLHQFGMTDQFLTRPVVEQIQGLLEPLPNVTWHGYETADHAFDNPDFFLYDAEASRLAWERTSAWLAATL